MKKMLACLVLVLMISSIMVVPANALGATYDANITKFGYYSNRMDAGDTQMIKITVKNTGTSDPYNGYASFLIKVKVYVDGSLLFSDDGKIFDIYYGNTKSISWEFTASKVGAYKYYAEAWNTPGSAKYDSAGPQYIYDVTGKGDLRVKSYTSGGVSSLTADTIVVYDSSWKEVTRKYGDNDHTFKDLSTGKYNVEIYEMNMFVDGAYNLDVAHGNTKTVSLYANSKVTLTIKAQFNDGSAFNGATVKLYSWDGYNSEWDNEGGNNTDNSGKTTFSVYPTTANGEKYRVYIFNSVGNYVGGNSNIRLTSSSTTTISTSQAPPPGSLRVKCFDSNNVGLTAETIIVYDSSYNEKDRKYNDNDHTFSGLSPGTYITEMYDMNMFIDSASNLQVTSGGTKTVSLKANAKVTLTVNVHYDDGLTDYTGAPVKLMSWDGYNDQWDLEASKNSDQQGQVSFSVYPTTANGEKYRVDVVSGGFLLGSNNDVTLSANKAISITTSVPVPPGDIRVKTLDENGVSLVAETILLFDNSWNELGRVYGDNDHTFSDLDVGTYTAQSYDMNMLISQDSNINVKAGETTTINLKANPKVTLTVTVLYNDDTTRHTDATVKLYSWDGYEDTWDSEDTVDCDVNGQVSFKVYPTEYQGEKYRVVVLNGQNIIGKDENIVLTDSTTKDIKTSEYPPLVGKIIAPIQTDYTLSKEMGTQTVQFTVQVSGGQGVKDITWSFGNGGSASGNQVSHDYTAPGTWIVTMKVSDDGGSVVEDSITITTYAYNNGLPIVTLISPANDVYIGDLDVINLTWSPFPSFHGDLSYDIYLDETETPTTKIATVTTTFYNASVEVLSIINKYQQKVGSGEIENMPPGLHWTIIPSNDMGDGTSENGPFTISLIRHDLDDEKNFIEDLIDEVKIKLNIGKFKPFFGTTREDGGSFFVGIELPDINLTYQFAILSVPCIFEIDLSGSISIHINENDEVKISGEIELGAYFGPGISTPELAEGFSLKLAILFGIKGSVSVDHVPENESLRLNFDVALSVKLCLFFVEATYNHNIFHNESETLISDLLPKEAKAPETGEDRENGDPVDSDDDLGSGDEIKAGTTTDQDPSDNEVGNNEVDENTKIIDNPQEDNEGGNEITGGDDLPDPSSDEIDPMADEDGQNPPSGQENGDEAVPGSPSSESSTRDGTDKIEADSDDTSEIWALTSGVSSPFASSPHLPQIALIMGLSIFGILAALLYRGKRRKDIALLRAKKRRLWHKKSRNDIMGGLSCKKPEEQRPGPNRPRPSQPKPSNSTGLSNEVAQNQKPSNRKARLANHEASMDLPIEDLGDTEIKMCGSHKEIVTIEIAPISESRLKVHTFERELDDVSWDTEDEILGPVITPTTRTLIATI